VRMWTLWTEKAYNRGRD